MLNEDRREALQEIANIGIGRAGAAIAEVLHHPVHLSVPRVREVSPEELPAVLRRSAGRGTVTAVRQSFHCQLRGEAIAIYPERGCSELAELMGYDGEADHAIGLELLLDVTNLLVGAFLSGIARQLNVETAFSAPSLLADSAPLETVLTGTELEWRSAVLVEVSFGLDGRSFSCHVMALMPESETQALAAMLDSFLERLR